MKKLKAIKKKNDIKVQNDITEKAHTPDYNSPMAGGQQIQRMDSVASIDLNTKVSPNLNSMNSLGSSTGFVYTKKTIFLMLTLNVQNLFLFTWYSIPGALSTVLSREIKLGQSQISMIYTVIAFGIMTLGPFCILMDKKFGTSVCL